MFIGHFAVAFGAKKAAPEVKLGTLIFAAEFPDLIFPVLTLAGLEHTRIVTGSTPFLRLDLYDYPVSHSLLLTLIWSGLIGTAYYLMNRQKSGAVVLGLAVLSHWILDLLTHIPDLPLAPGIDKLVGLGLWHSTAGTLIIETGLFAAGIILYLRTTKTKDITGIITLWALVLFLLSCYAASILSAPPPGSNTIPVAVVGLSMWLFIPWGYWIDRHREKKSCI